MFNRCEVTSDYGLLKNLCAVHAPSSDESRMTMFLLEYIEKNSFAWRHKPKLFYGEDYQECVMMVWGKPRTAIVAHIDSVGFMVGYGKKLIPIGSPRCEDATSLVGYENGKEVSCVCKKTEDGYEYAADQTFERGTLFTYKPNFFEDEKYIVSPFLDNRVGVYVALRLAERMKSGAILFTTGEETGSGNVKYCWRHLYKMCHIHNALIADITWITEGIRYGEGCAVSLKDTNIPRRIFVDKIINIAKREGLRVQLEVESAGGSDGASLQRSPYAVNWCFVGAAEEYAHTPNERMCKDDIESMYELYKALIENL